MNTAMPRYNPARSRGPWVPPARTAKLPSPPSLPPRQQRLPRPQNLRAPVQLNVLLFNVHGLTLLKWQTLKLLATNHKDHVVVLTETHLGVTPPPYIVNHHICNMP